MMRNETRFAKENFQEVLKHSSEFSVKRQNIRPDKLPWIITAQKIPKAKLAPQKSMQYLILEAGFLEALQAP